MTIKVHYSKMSRHPEWPEVPDILTVVVEYPRFIHAELMTHRAFSRNASSSRAVPTPKMLKRILKDMAVPVSWGANQPGMQAGAEMTGWKLKAVKAAWKTAGYFAVGAAWLAWKAGAHKQVVNRIVEPWSHITVIITATEWDNFFKLRCHPAADPTMFEKDKGLYDRLLADGHMSPFEHYAVAVTVENRNHANFHPGWEQLRSRLK